MIDLNWSPTTRQLRQFGLISFVALPLLAWLWGGSWTLIGILSGIGAVAALLGFVFPAALKPAYLAMSLVAAPIGIVVGELALLLVFFGVLLPIGIVFRLLRRDPLRREFDRSAETYFQPKRQPDSAARYHRQS
jgi:hypothetical protein